MESRMEILTNDELERVKAKLEKLQANRAVLSKRIGEARELGDISENAEYHAAKDQQGLEEAEIRRLEDRLANASVVDESQAKEAAVVFIGSLVKLKDVDTGVEELFKLVGEMADDPPDDYDEVTVSSPMGEALMKARVGETVSVRAPRGVKRFEVVELL
jgi:transcription elongation factor GreA